MFLVLSGTHRGTSDWSPKRPSCQKHIQLEDSSTHARHENLESRSLETPELPRDETRSLILGPQCAQCSIEFTISVGWEKLSSSTTSQVPMMRVSRYGDQIFSMVLSMKLVVLSTYRAWQAAKDSRSRVNGVES
ncbi:hypothetical protein QCA50_011027 [Cerrena zonata]|uniref:Uncharacterized protein n=1 Tax=Cerrena zonata TaxID=2478898 RepID=A0AAW0G6T0_9APHY